MEQKSEKSSNVKQNGGIENDKQKNEIDSSNDTKIKPQSNNPDNSTFKAITSSNKTGISIFIHRIKCFFCV